MSRLFPFPAPLFLCAVLVAAAGLVSAADPPRSPGEEPAVDANPPESTERPFVQLKSQDTVPTVRAIVPLDGANVFFLNHRGQIGIAKFSPGMSQIGWQFYSEVKLSALPAIAIGPRYSVITASPNEVTQAFDTNKDVALDFFQALVRDWVGRDTGVVITAGPVADPFGRILFALSPSSAGAAEPALARIVAWHPAAKEPVTVTESELRVEAFAVNRAGLLAARLHMPDYPDGYFLSLTALPPFVADRPDAAPTPLPKTLPSLVIPAEMTRKSPPTQLCFFEEDDREKLLLTCPGSRRLIEVTPDNVGAVWQGSLLLRAETASPIHALAEMSPGMILGGGENGFVPLTGTAEPYRITRLALAGDGIVLDLNRPVNRLEAAQPGNYLVKALAATGSTDLPVSEVVIESDGGTVVLKTDAIPVGTVLRVLCKNLPSEKGEPLLDPECFYTLHAREGE
ncbi:MAG: hypothetical protein GXX91_09420 [Verrucomicrobiaceae bacterium]|nr:hypothetical protein [Verrucomicrobiaceae bacterium]